MQDSVNDGIQGAVESLKSISKFQKALLVTDGSVTRLLEVFSDAPVGVKTNCQNIIPAPQEVAELLEILPGDEVNYREVDLFNKKTQINLIHAISYAPLSRLPPDAINRLMKEDEPIGNIMRDAKMESRREILSVRKNLSDSPDWMRKQDCQPGPCISRSYRIIHNCHPIFLIHEFIPDHLFSDLHAISIRTPSRLHIGLLDMNGSTGRIDGGAGITLDTPGFEIRISESESFSLFSSDQGITTHVMPVIERLKRNGLEIPPVHIEIVQAIPFHCGLGSGTQLALGIAAGMRAMLGQSWNDEDLISFSGRGGTSGIGTRAFFQGGFIVDAGHRFGPGKAKSVYAPSSASSGAGESPLVGRYQIPGDWRFIIAIPHGGQEIQGRQEREIFQTCCPVPIHEVQILSHLTLMKLIPSVIEHDLDEFGAAINQYQEFGFKKCELNLQPPVIQTVMHAMRDAGASGVGMSSFGPVIYAVCDTGSADVIAAAKQVMQSHSGGEVFLSRGRNRGADITTHP